MQILKETIEIKKTARYYVLGRPGPAIRRVWFVCHGYGQLAEPFLQEFRVLDDSRTLVVAPEAPHRFYMRGAGHQVGASWMTKEERLADIADYVTYLDTVYAAVLKGLGKKPDELKIDVLGFSQGAATAWRWAMQGESPAQRLILWGGDVPPDAHWETCRSRLKNMELLLVSGDKDPLMKPGFLEQQRALLELHNIRFSSHSFDGYHEIKPGMLETLN